MEAAASINTPCLLRLMLDCKTVLGSFGYYEIQFIIPGFTNEQADLKTKAKNSDESYITLSS